MFNKKQLTTSLFQIFLFLLAINLTAQTDYRNYAEITNKLKSIESKNASIVKLNSLTKTVGGFDIWGLTLAIGNPATKPAIAIVGGINGSLLLTTEMALNIAENLVENHKEILEKTTFYIFPNMSPNASEQYFSTLKYENQGNATSTDDDRDGKFNEDPFEDLNKDGFITLIRVADVTGEFKKLEEDERIMVKADKTKGELGTYKVFSEGFDNDKDGKFNEDAKGGVQFNKNLSYNYQYFQPGTGEHAVSEKEHRALLDFLYEQWNIFAIVTLGPDNNLSNPLKYNKGDASKRVVSSILKDDETINEFLSTKYNKIINEKDAPKTTSEGGGFFEWSYFHFGKLAMSTPGWWPPKFKGDSIVKTPENADANFLKWAEKEKIETPFIEWTSINHPDFPNKKVEIGGIRPFIQNNPPYSLVNEISKKHTDFIIELAKIQPKITIQNSVIEKIDNNVTRVTIDVHNLGYLPTHTEMGKKSRWLQKIKLAVNLSDGQELISGKKVELIDSIDGDSTVKKTWLIKGNGTATIQVGAAHTGSETITINLN